jgi:hypothetical protein
LRWAVFARGNLLPVRRDYFLVSAFGRREKRKLVRLRRGQPGHDRTFLFDVVAVARPFGVRVALAATQTAKSTKALGAGWWNGTNLWRALTGPPFDIIPADLLVRFKHVFPILGIAVFLLEIGYPFFIWHRHLRRPWLFAILAMHLAIGLAMGMYLFASVMIVLNLAAFGPSILWNRRQARDDGSSFSGSMIPSPNN